MTSSLPHEIPRADLVQTSCKPFGKLVQTSCRPCAKVYSKIPPANLSCKTRARPRADLVLKFTRANLRANPLPISWKLHATSCRPDAKVYSKIPPANLSCQTLQTSCRPRANLMFTSCKPTCRPHANHRSENRSDLVQTSCQSHVTLEIPPIPQFHGKLMQIWDDQPHVYLVQTSCRPCAPLMHTCVQISCQIVCGDLVPILYNPRGYHSLFDLLCKPRSQPHADLVWTLGRPYAQCWIRYWFTDLRLDVGEFKHVEYWSKTGNVGEFGPTVDPIHVTSELVQVWT